MISIYDFQELLGTAFFDGDMKIAGMIMYVVVLMLIFALSKKVNLSLILSVPITLIFGYIGALDTDLMVLLIILAVLGLAFTVRNVWK